MSDRERWDRKHAEARGRPVGEPDPLVVAALEGLAPGRALELAAGTGRHALELLRRGWSVEAWDVSPVGLEVLAERAELAGGRVAARAVDLVHDGIPADAGTYDLVLVVSFLDRPLFARLARLVAPGGHALVSTFTEDWSGDHPPARYRLSRAELAAGLAGLATVTSREEGGRALVLARKEPSAGST